VLLDALLNLRRLDKMMLQYGRLKVEVFKLAFLTYYTDPKKKKLQIIEIVAVVILLIVGIIFIPPIIKEHQQFQTAVAFHNMGHEHLHSNNDEAALECFQAAIRTYPMEESFLEIASIHHFKGNHEKEIEVYRDGLKSLKDSSKLRCALATEYYLQEKYDEAITESEIALKIDPYNSEAKNILEHCQKYKAHPEKRGKHNLNQEELNKRYNINHQHNGCHGH